MLGVLTIMRISQVVLLELLSTDLQKSILWAFREVAQCLKHLLCYHEDCSSDHL